MGAWREVKTDADSEVPAGRGGAACVAIDGQRLLLYGGADRTPTTFNDWWLLELTGAGADGHWTKVSPVVKLTKKCKLLPRSGASLTYLPAANGSGGGKVYLYGGQDPVAGVFFDDLLCLDTASWELTDVLLACQPPPLPPNKQQRQAQAQQQRRHVQQRPPARHSHVAGAYEQLGIIVFGGAGLRGPLNDVWLFELGTAGWRCLSAELAEEECPDGREMAAGTMISEAGLLVHGGRGADGGMLDDICIFDGRASRWVLVQATGYARCAHTACNAAVLPHPTTSSGGGGTAQGGGQVPAAAGAPATATAVAAAEAGGGGGGGKHASNVLLCNGFTGETVAGDLLQLTFLRQQRSSGGFGLRAELRSVKAAAEGAPPPRFAHTAAVLAGPEAAELVVLGGVNQTDDLSDVWCWAV